MGSCRSSPIVHVYKLRIFFRIYILWSTHWWDMFPNVYINDIRCYGNNYFFRQEPQVAISTHFVSDMLPFSDIFPSVFTVNLQEKLTQARPKKKSARTHEGGIFFRFRIFFRGSKFEVRSSKFEVRTISYQLWIISYQLSAITYQLSAINNQLSTISYHLSTITCQLSAIKY